MPLKIHYDTVGEDVWADYARAFTDYSIYQSCSYQQVRSETDRQVLSRFVITDTADNPVMMGHVRIKTIRALGLRVGYVQRGPLFLRNGQSADQFSEAFALFHKTYVGPVVNVLRVVPNVCQDDTRHAIMESIEKHGFRSVRHVSPYRTFLVAVDDSEEEIRKRLRKSFRRDVKYAEKTAFEVVEGTDPEYFVILENLYKQLIERKKFKGLDPQEFIKTQQKLRGNEKLNVIVAWLDKEPVAALLAANQGDTSIVLLAANSDRGLENNSAYLIWYRGAVSAFHAGKKKYDLGGIDPHENPSVYQFKSRMGGRDTTFVGAFEATKDKWTQMKWRVVEKLACLFN